MVTLLLGFEFNIVEKIDIVYHLHLADMGPNFTMDGCAVHAKRISFGPGETFGHNLPDEDSQIMRCPSRIPGLAIRAYI